MVARDLPVEPIEVAPGRLRFTVAPLEMLVAMGLLNASVLEDDSDVDTDAEVSDAVL